MFDYVRLATRSGAAQLAGRYRRDRRCTTWFTQCCLSPLRCSGFRFRFRFRSAQVVDVGVIDEIQLLADPSRGWAWTRALFGIPAREACRATHLDPPGFFPGFLPRVSPPGFSPCFHFLLLCGLGCGPVGQAARRSRASHWRRCVVTPYRIASHRIVSLSTFRAQLSWLRRAPLHRPARACGRGARTRNCARCTSAGTRRRCRSCVRQQPRWAKRSRSATTSVSRRCWWRQALPCRPSLPLRPPALSCRSALPPYPAALPCGRSLPLCPPALSCRSALLPYPAALPSRPILPPSPPALPCRSALPRAPVEAWSQQQRAEVASAGFSCFRLGFPRGRLGFPAFGWVSPRPAGVFMLSAGFPRGRLLTLRACMPLVGRRDRCRGITLLCSQGTR